MAKFIVESTECLLVLQKVSDEDILQECGLSSKTWTYAPLDKATPWQEMAHIVVGHFDFTATIAEILSWVSEHGQSDRLVGSGAWVRSAYLHKFPEYDGKGPILFPCNNSLWRDLYETRGRREDPYFGLCATGAWHDNGRVGPYSFDWVGDRWREGKRVALIRP